MRGTDDAIFARKYSHAKMHLQPYLEQHGQHLSLLNHALCLHKIFLVFFSVMFFAQGCNVQLQSRLVFVMLITGFIIRK